jgi:hypothetical protein
MAYYHYSDDPLAPRVVDGSATVKYVPFRVFAKIVPDKMGRRMVRFRDLQKLASFIETDIIDNVSEVNIAEPVAFTPQFGNRAARATIVGFMAVDSDSYPNIPPTSLAKIIHSGTIPGEATSVQTGPTGGSTSWGQEVETVIDDQVRYLKATLEAASQWLDTIFFMEYNGVKYGNGHRTFPH